jgi:hypothetical protein
VNDKADWACRGPNPYFVLEVDSSASAAEIERAAQLWLGLLAIQAQGSGTCSTQQGPMNRDPETVRQALALLRDPVRRARCALWFQLTVPPWALVQIGPTVPWAEAAQVLGWADE